VPPAQFDTHTVESFDGTPLACHTAGAWQDASRPTIVLANGLGGTHGAFRHLVSFLSDRFRFLAWDYRGLFSSGRPRDPNEFGMGAQVRDLYAVLDAHEVREAIFVGWSMGVQVSLEALREKPEIVRGLVLLNGTFGRPFSTLPGGPLAARVVPALLMWLRRYHGLSSVALRRVAGWPETIGWIKRLGIVGETIDEEVFAEAVSSFGNMDLDAYFRTLHALGEHDAVDVLPTVKVPTLVVTGDRDLMTPRRIAERIAGRIPGGELLVVKGGTHYTAVEFPELVNLRVQRFLRERGLWGE
jgi:pimeloyl-ACP methyl ester carboxylesterase